MDGFGLASKPLRNRLFGGFLLIFNHLERFPKGVTRLSDKKRDLAKTLEPIPIQMNRDGL
jgi:hypothetical protein